MKCGKSHWKNYLCTGFVFQEFDLVWTWSDSFAEHHLTQILDGRIVFIDGTKVKMMILIWYYGLLSIQTIHVKRYDWLSGEIEKKHMHIFGILKIEQQREQKPVKLTATICICSVFLRISKYRWYMLLIQYLFPTAKQNVCFDYEKKSLCELWLRI